MKIFNRRHQKGNGYNPTSISLANELLTKHRVTVTNALSVFLDLNPHLVGSDFSDTQERISRYFSKQVARDATERLQVSDNAQDKEILHYYLNQSDI